MPKCFFLLIKINRRSSTLLDPPTRTREKPAGVWRPSIKWRIWDWVWTRSGTRTTCSVQKSLWKTRSVDQTLMTFDPFELHRMWSKWFVCRVALKWSLWFCQDMLLNPEYFVDQGTTFLELIALVEITFSALNTCLMNLVCCLLSLHRGWKWPWIRLLSQTQGESLVSDASRPVWWFSSLTVLFSL